jgi:CheY-like chemotaxis protein
MRLAGQRVLLVDDDADVLAVERATLENAGASVACAVSVAEAAEAFSTFDPSVIVTDLAMPMVSGFDLLAELKVFWAIHPERTVPVLLLTAHARKDVARDALARGFTEVLAKPLEPEALVDAVARAVAR